MRNSFLLPTTLLLFLAFVLAVSCSGESSSDATADRAPVPEAAPPADPKGIGEIRHVDLTTPVDEDMVDTGQAIYEMKCSACHKLSDQRVVGPGWAGVTNRRRPEWIMNMITNVDVMLEEDPQAQAMLEECLTRMPNQGVATGDARALLEFMRKNDMETVGSMDEGLN
jgi:mono/diheme cytochrome c family protein